MLYFSNKHVKIHIQEFFEDFWATRYENFEKFSDIFENYLNTFSCRFRPLELLASLVSSINPTIFSESPIELWQFFWFLKKYIFKPNISKMFIKGFKHAIFFDLALLDEYSRFFCGFLVRFVKISNCFIIKILTQFWKLSKHIFLQISSSRSYFRFRFFHNSH